MATLRSSTSPPRPKKRRLSLKLKKPMVTDKENDPNSSNSERFGVIDDSSLKDLAKPFAPKNTQLNTQWAMINYNSWWQWRCKQSQTDDDKPPEDILKPECSIALLNQWLPYYVSETRNKEGKRYSPKTLYSLLSGILRHMRIENPHYPNFLDKSNADFVVLHRSIDNVFRKLRDEGVGSDSKQTAGITREEENLLWENGILNTATPIGLFRAVFFLQWEEFYSSWWTGAPGSQVISNCTLQ